MPTLQGTLRAGAATSMLLLVALTTGCGVTVPTDPMAMPMPMVPTLAPAVAPAPTRPAPLSRSARRLERNRPDASAMLTGGAAASAIGGFTFHPNPDGSISVDPAWVTANIRTETLPLVGDVTCHRLVLPQLRGALEEISTQGWASLVRSSDFGGCWVPRYIRHDPTGSLSLHSWGIAVDFNVSTNQRSTVGDMDPRVIEVMARWGFAWGGTWSDPDPMHFELAALMQPSA